MIPRAHMSTRFPYLWPVACSGAMYKIVPITSFILSCPWNTFACTSALRPKSAILAVYLSAGSVGYVPSSLKASLIRIFSGLRSLWIKFFLCIYNRPSRMSRVILLATSSSIILSFGGIMGDPTSERSISCLRSPVLDLPWSLLLSS